jgi:hypothetical protein
MSSQRKNGEQRKEKIRRAKEGRWVIVERQRKNPHFREQTCSEVRTNRGILQDTLAGRDDIDKIFIHKKLLKFNDL